jgi:glycine oxidase
MKNQTYDICIVGNGSLAGTLAFRLIQENPSLKIALVGPESRFGSATRAAAAMFNVWCELAPGHLEDPLFAKRFHLTRSGAENWTALLEKISSVTGEKVEPKWGTYLIKTCRSTEIEENAFRYVEKKVQENNIEHKKVSPSDLPWLKGMHGSHVIEAMYIKNDGRVDSRLVLKNLDAANKKLGVEIFNDEVTELKLAKSGFLRTNSDHEISTKTGAKISAKNIVLANGAFAQSLIDQNPDIAKEIPRLLFGIGSGLDVSMPDWVKQYGGLGKEIMDLDAVVRTTDRGGACGVHVVPYGDGKFYAGASSLTSLTPDFTPTLHATHFLLEALVNEINRSFFNANIAFRGVGFRPTSADTFPLLGETSVKGLWMLNGTKRDGFTMSAYLSLQLAKNILGEAHELPQEFKPCRKLISYKNKEHAIKDAEFMYVGADAQHGGMSIPYMVDKYREMRRNEIVKIYDKRNLGDFGIHPELLHLYENDDFYAKIKQ